MSDLPECIICKKPTNKFEILHSIKKLAIEADPVFVFNPISFQNSFYVENFLAVNVILLRLEKIGNEKMHEQRLNVHVQTSKTVSVSITWLSCTKLLF